MRNEDDYMGMICSLGLRLWMFTLSVECSRPVKEYDFDPVLSLLALALLKERDFVVDFYFASCGIRALSRQVAQRCKECCLHSVCVSPISSSWYRPVPFSKYWVAVSFCCLTRSEHWQWCWSKRRIRWREGCVRRFPCGN